MLFLFVFQSALYAEPRDDPPTAPPTLAEEIELLRTLKAAEFEKLKVKIFGDSSYKDKLDALKKIAGLATHGAVELLATLYDNPISEAEKVKTRERLLIVELLGEIGAPAGAPTVQKAARDPQKDGEIRHVAAKALWKTMDKQALPHLKKLSEDPVEAVRNAAWTELLKVSDMGAMRHVFKTLQSEKKLTAIQMIKDAHFTEAAEDVAKLAKETDFAKGPNEKILKLKALETALDLGHKESIAVAIELIGAITKGQAQVLKVKLPLWLLNIYTTYQYFHSDKKRWQVWWDGKGKTTPLLSSYIDATSLKGIGNAVIEWTRDKKSGPLLKSSVVYLADSPVARVIARPDGTIRVYTEAEFEILKVNCMYVGSVSSNGTSASVILQFSVEESGVCLGLQKKDSAWQVTGISEGDR